MKKLLVLGTIPLLLCSCASDPVIEEREYMNPEMDTGKQVTHLGYRSMEVDTYCIEEGEEKNLKRKQPDNKEIISYDTKGNCKERVSYVLENDDLIFAYDEKLTYSETEVSAVDSYDSNGILLTKSIKQEDGSWQDQDSQGNILPQSNIRDTYGNICEKTEADKIIKTTFDLNGNILDLKEVTLEGTELSDIVYQRNTNGHLPDVIIEKDETGKSKKTTLLRGDLVNNVVTNIYTDSDGKETERHYDTYDDNGLLIKCKIKESNSAKLIIKKYIYSK